MATLKGKKLKKRLRVKYDDYWGYMMRKRDMPKYCYNEGCKHHSIMSFGDCLYSKCRFKNNRFKPSIENEHFWDKMIK